MNFLVKCKICGTQEWVKGEDDPDTNSCEVDELSCGHDDFEILDSEYPTEDDVWT